MLITICCWPHYYQYYSVYHQIWFVVYYCHCAEWSFTIDTILIVCYYHSYLALSLLIISSLIIFTDSHVLFDMIVYCYLLLRVSTCWYLYFCSSFVFVVAIAADLWPYDWFSSLIIHSWLPLSMKWWMCWTQFTSHYLLCVFFFRWAYFFQLL